MADGVEHIEQELKELKQLIQQKTSNGNGSWSSHLKGIQAFVYLLVILVGMGVSWGVSTSKLSATEARVQQLSTDLESAKKNLRELELKQAGDDKVLETLQADITEMKADIKKLVSRRGSGD